MSGELPPREERSFEERFPRVDLERAERLVRAFLCPQEEPIRRQAIDELFQVHKNAFDRAQQKYELLKEQLAKALMEAAAQRQIETQEIQRLLRRRDPRLSVAEKIQRQAIEKGLLSSSQDIRFEASVFVSQVRERDLLQEGADLLKGAGEMPGGSVFTDYHDSERTRRLRGREEWTSVVDPRILKACLLLGPKVERLTEESLHLFKEYGDALFQPEIHLHVITEDCLTLFERAQRRLSKASFTEEGSEVVSLRLLSEQAESYRWLFRRCLHAVVNSSANELGLDQSTEERIQRAGVDPMWADLMRSVLGKGEEEKRVNRLERTHAPRILTAADESVHQWLQQRNIFQAQGIRVHPHIAHLMRYVFAGEILSQEFPLPENPFLRLLELADEEGCFLLPHERGAIIVLPERT